MFSPFSSFPVPQPRPEPWRDHLMDWVGWRGADYVRAPDEGDSPPEKPGPLPPVPGRH